MSLCLWVGWPLQHEIIDGPACQGVLIWDEVCQVGMWVMYLQLPVQSQIPVPFVACICNVEGCGLIADALNLLFNNHSKIRLDCCVPYRCCRSMVVFTEGGDPCLSDREICA